MLLAKVAETDANGVAGPGLAARVPEDRVVPLGLRQQLPGQFEGFGAKVNDPGPAGFLHRLVLGEDPESSLQIDDLPVDASDLAWPTTGECHGLHELTERLALDGREDQLTFRRGKNSVAHEALGL